MQDRSSRDEHRPVFENSTIGGTAVACYAMLYGAVAILADNEITINRLVFPAAGLYVIFQILEYILGKERFLVGPGPMAVAGFSGLAGACMGFL